MTSPPDRGPQRQALNTSDLWRSVDRLTKDRTQRLVRQLTGSKASVEHVKVPSLWTQLVEAIAASSSGGDQRGGSTGSRSPLDLAIEALLADMSSKLRAGLAKLGHQPRVLAAQPLTSTPRRPPQLVDDEKLPVLDPDVGGQLAEAAARSRLRRDTARIRHDVLSDIRQYAAAVVSTNQQDRVDECAAQYAWWVRQAEEILTGDEEAIDLRGIRGHACPHCSATYVERVEPSLDPRAVDGFERFRDAALVIAFRDGQVQHVTCRACETGWWRGDDVDQLSNEIRATTALTPQAARGDARRTDYDEANAGGRLSGMAPEEWWPWPDTTNRGGSAA